MIRMNKKGFTLVEIMIVVAIIGLLAAIAIPNFLKARTQARKNICISNLRTLYHALEEYMIDQNKSTGVTLDVSSTASDLIGDEDYIKDVPRCPIDNDTYPTLTTGEKPVCPNYSTNSSDPGYGHSLP